MINALLKQARLVSPHFRYRPLLDDPKDDLYIDCALSAGAQRIVTNDKHFQHPAVRGFGITTCRAGDLVAELKRRHET